MGAPRPQKALSRFLAKGLSPGAQIYLDEGEAHHLTRVLRLKEGAEVILIDGEGHEYLGVVERIRRKEVLVLSKRELRAEPPPEKEITVFLPLLKRELTAFLTEKAVELGVTRLVPFFSTRTVAKAGENFRKRLEERALQALKQCRRLWALRIEEPSPLEALEIAADLKLMAYEAEKERSPKGLLACFSGRSLALISGPEGGFALKEAELLKEKGFLPITLGPYILRAETAALYLMSLAHSWGYL